MAPKRGSTDSPKRRRAAAPAQEPPTAAAEDQQTTAVPLVKCQEPPASPGACVVHGMEQSLTVNKPAEFSIEAYDSTGVKKNDGGDAFFIAIRGASRVRARVADENTGTYKITWKPIVSGEYTIAVSLFGVSLPGSPFDVHVFDPAPYAPKCEVSGDALNFITARSTWSFDMRFRDRGGNIAQAVDLDVFVDQLPNDPEAASLFAKAWELATRRKIKEPKAPPTKASDDAEDKQPSAWERVRSKGKRAAAAAAPASELPAPDAPPQSGGASSSSPPGARPPPPAAQGNFFPVDAGSADEASADDDMVTGEEVEAMKTRQRTIRIQVGRRSLIVRAEAELDSPQIATLLPCQTVTVVEERITDGYVRACVTFEDMSDLAAVPEDEDAMHSSSTSVTFSSPGGGSQTSARPLSARPTSPTGSVVSATGAGKLLTGWVTLKKNGKKLVSSRLKLDTTARQSYLQQWNRRQLNDKLKHDVSNELTTDPTGVGFAFGGVYPGYIHAKGRMVEKHTVSYSVGRVGRYLLHVRLRQQALPIPGSPFALEVSPGNASSRSTSIYVDESQPLRGPVGSGDDEGCKITFSTSDLMGNVCDQGGAKVETICDNDIVQAECTDNQDGTYLLHWRSRVSGTFVVKVMIDQVQIIGSPLKVKMISTNPELSKCDLRGEGLKNAIAGQPARLTIKFIDSYGNNASPGPQLKVGVGLAHDKKRVIDVKEHPFEAYWGDEDSGEYHVSFMATTAGHAELHVWCDPHSKDERYQLPGSPFPLHVTAGAPTATASLVDGWTRESRGPPEKGAQVKKANANSEPTVEKIIAGDMVSVKPQIVDKFNNPATLSDDSLIATLLRPDNSELKLNLLTTVVKSSQLSQYEIKTDTHLAGAHQIHIKLDGDPIVGSPIEFEVHGGGPDPHYSKLVPPENFEALTPDFENPTIVILATFDKFGNPCTSGGLVPTSRLSLVKQSASDQTLLMANNHSVSVDDLHNGTYAVKVLIKMACMVKLIVNMDKNIPAGGGELPAATLTFVSTGEEEGGEAPESFVQKAPVEQPKRGRSSFALQGGRRGTIRDSREAAEAHTAVGEVASAQASAIASVVASEVAITEPKSPPGSPAK